MPDWIVPMAATLTQERFTGPEWLFEQKFDGIRLLAYKRGSNVELYSRNRLPQDLPHLAAAIAALPVTEAILDVARAGMGIAALSEWIASPHLGKGDLVARRLASGPLRRPWRVAWRREVGDAALRLVSALESTVPRGLAVG